jgi:two-component system, OmpR family, response regulator
MTRHKILVVDDNQELLRLLARLVEAEGWQPVTCARGKAALDAIVAESPAVAIVDVLLPDMMGYDVAAALKKNGVPFVFMTGIFKGGRAASEARVQHGAAGYFEKPFEAKKLLEMIRGLLPPEPPRREPPQSPPPLRKRREADFDVEIPVEADEPLDALTLTGKVEVTESGRISAVIRGQSLEVAPVNVAAPRPEPRPPRAGPPEAGELRDNLPDLVTAFWLTQQTGELAVQRGKVKKAVYFENGRPCYAISNLVADRFGHFLVRVGKISQGQLAMCQAAADKTGRRSGEVLVEMGLMKEAEKLYYVAQQVKAIAYSLFAWEDGQYRLHFSNRAADEATKIDMHPAHLIARGVRKLYKPDRVARLLGAGDRLIPTQQPAYGLHEVQLERWEAELLPRVDGTRTATELVAVAKRPDAEVRSFLWSLVALDILEKRT